MELHHSLGALAQEKLPLGHPVREFLKVWTAIVERDGSPQWSSFSPGHVPQLLPNIMVLRAYQDGTLRYSICGEECNRLLGTSFQGKSFGEGLQRQDIDAIATEFDLARKTAKPSFSFIRLPEEGREFISVFRGCFPFFNGDQLTRFIVVLGRDVSNSTTSPTILGNAAEQSLNAFSSSGPGPILTGQSCPDKTDQLLELWEERRGQRELPARKEFPVEQLRPWLGNLQLVEVMPNEASERRYRFRLVGEEITKIDGRDITGKFAEDVFSGDLAWITKDYDRVVCFRRPERSVFRRPAPVERNMAPSVLEVSRLMLPLSDDGDAVNMLMVYLHIMDTHYTNPFVKKDKTIQ